MKRAVRTTVPPRVTSDTVTTFRTIVTSTLRPARVALTSYVFVSSPASTTISTLSPFIASPRVLLPSAVCDVDSSRSEGDPRVVILYFAHIVAPTPPRTLIVTKIGLYCRVAARFVKINFGRRDRPAIIKPAEVLPSWTPAA
jgi:hypothetical protein